MGVGTGSGVREQGGIKGEGEGQRKGQGLGHVVRGWGKVPLSAGT